MTRVILRRALPSDEPAVRAIHVAAFERDLEADLYESLRRDGDLIPALCFVVVERGEAVAHVATSAGRIAGRVVPAVGPIGVLPAHQHRGLGSALVHAVVGGAEALGERCVVLLGSPAYYGRFGFGPADPVEAPDPRWGEAFQVRRLTAWDGSMRGPFAYAPAFG